MIGFEPLHHIYVITVNFVIFISISNSSREQVMRQNYVLC